MTTGGRSRGADWLIVLCWSAWAILGYVFVDVTVFGPTQADTFYQAERIASLSSFPSSGPVPPDGFSLGPAASFLLSPALLVGDSPGAIHRWMWLLSTFFIGLAILRIRANAGSAVAMICAALMPPQIVWLSLYSSHAAALLFPVGCLIAAWSLSLLNDNRRSGVWLALAVTAAIQLHPSAIGLWVGIVLLALIHGRREWGKPMLLGFLLGVAAWLPWIWGEISGDWEQTQRAIEVWLQSIATAPASILSLEKWKDWAFQPFSMIAAIPAFDAWSARGTLFLQLIILSLTVLGVVVSREARALAVPLAIWMIACIAAVTSGDAVRTELILPMMILVGALGLTKSIGRWSRLLAPLALLLALFNGALVIDLKRTWHELGRLNVVESTLTYPQSESKQVRTYRDYSSAVEIYEGLSAAAIPRARIAGSDHIEMLRSSGGWFDRLLTLGEGRPDMRCAIVVDQRRWQTPELLEHAPGAIYAGQLTGFLLRRCEIYGPGDVRVSVDGRLITVDQPSVLMAFLVCDNPVDDSGARLLNLAGTVRPDVQRRTVSGRQYQLLTWSLSPRRGPYRYREPTLGECVPAGPAVSFNRRQGGLRESL